MYIPVYEKDCGIIDANMNNQVLLRNSDFYNISDKQQMPLKTILKIILTSINFQKILSIIQLLRRKN